MILHKLYQGYAIIVEAAPVTGNHARILLDGKLVHTTALATDTPYPCGRGGVAAMSRTCGLLSI
jgi:hypothetical protein